MEHIVLEANLLNGHSRSHSYEYALLFQYRNEHVWTHCPITENPNYIFSVYCNPNLVANVEISTLTFYTFLC